MKTEDPIDYDAIMREAAALRAEAIADMGRELRAFFRRKWQAKPMLG